MPDQYVINYLALALCTALYVGTSVLTLCQV